MTDEEMVEYRNRNEIVTRRQQYEQGLLPEPRRNFVSMPQASQPVRFNPHQVDLAINHPATQHVELRTSAVDRAQGFQWMIAPISVVVAVLAVLVSVAFQNEFLSFWSLLIFWTSFCVVYVAGWILTALVTPEFVSLFSAWRQWNVIDREQKERWSHYKWESGRTIETRQSGPVVPGWVLFVAGLAGVVCAVLYLVGV